MPLTYSDIQKQYDQLMWKNADYTQVSALFDDVDLELTSNSGDNFYHAAAQHLDVQLAKLLSENGIRPKHNDNGDSPLNKVIALFQWEPKAQQIEEFTRILIDAGLNLKRKNSRNQSLAQMCVEKANWAVLQPLIEAGAKVDDVVAEQKNLLHLICSRMQGNSSNKQFVDNGTKVLKLLIDSQQIDPEDKDMFGTTPITYLQRANLLEVASLLTDQDESQMGGMELDQAVLLKNHQVIQSLLENGSDANYVSEQYGNRSVLMIACQNADDKTIELLLNHGADPNYRLGQSGYSCATFLLNEGLKNIRNVPPGKFPPQLRNSLRLLKKHGWNASTSIDNQENTPLHIAVSGAYFADTEYDLIETLIDMGANPNNTNANGQTPLMIYAQNGDENKHGLAELLIDSDSSVDIRDKYGRTALHYATTNSKHNSALKIAKLIVEQNPQIVPLSDNNERTAIDEAVETNNEQLIKFLLSL